MRRASPRGLLLLAVAAAGLGACSSRYFDVDQIAPIQAGVSSDSVRALIRKPALKSCEVAIDGHHYWLDTFYVFVGNRSPYDLPATNRRSLHPIDWPYHFLFEGDSLVFWGFPPAFDRAGVSVLAAVMDSCWWGDPLSPFRFADDLEAGQTRDTAQGVVFGWRLDTFEIEDIPHQPPLTVSAYNLFRGRDMTYFLIFDEDRLRYWGFLNELARSLDPIAHEIRDRIWTRWPITYNEEQVDDRSAPRP